MRPVASKSVAGTFRLVAPDAGIRQEGRVISAKSVIDALPMAALLTDQAGRIEVANMAARRAFGADPSGQNIIMFLRSPAIGQALRDAAAKGEASTVTHTLHGTGEQTYEISVSRLDDGKTVLFILADKTREQQIERMRSDFVANASHELRTPLATLSGFIETMQSSAKDDKAARERFLAVMATQADRMSRLIDDLLSLSRIEIAEHVAPTSRADLGDVARQAVGLLAALAAELGCTLVIDAPVALPIIGDTAELVQVAHNLIENAIRYGASGKNVEISARAENGRAVLAVRDFGPGIAAHHVPRLTERFYRVNVQDSRTRGGTGLGLAIVKHILNRHRGRLAIESEPGRGSCFTVSLSLQKRDKSQ